MWKNVNPVYSVGIQTHNLWNVSLLPWPLDQGSRPYIQLFFFLIYGYYRILRENLYTKVSRNNESVIYRSVKFYGINHRGLCHKNFWVTFQSIWKQFYAQITNFSSDYFSRENCLATFWATFI